ncbi:hypothetical protein [Nocardia sp. NPDC052316]|uniref:hypothetical protein n=1 Tax=Nocardia sp. NPDC052316 TaxID=3364329 RepID=UPI0037C8E654
MSYPQYPGGYNPYPAYSAGVPAPSGATAVTAGVLACIGSIGQLLGGGISLAFGLIGWQLQDYDTSGLFSQDWFQTWAIVSGVLSLVTAVVLGVGAVAMFSRRSFGRLLVVVGCVTVVVAQLVGFVLVRSIDGSSDGLGVISDDAGSLIGLIFPVATAVLALIPPTTRWLAYSPAAAVPRQYGYPYPGPPQPGLSWQPVADQAWHPVADQDWHQPSAPRDAWSAPAQPAAEGGGSVQDDKAVEESSAPQVAWNLSAQPPPSSQGDWPPVVQPVPDEETVRHPPSGQPKPQDDSVRRPPPA